MLSARPLQPSRPSTSSRRRSAAVSLTAAWSLAVLAPAVLAGCGDDEVEDGTPSTEPIEISAESLDGRTFLSTDVAGFELVEGSSVRLVFQDGRLTISADCNIMGGGYSIDGATLLLNEMSTTEMGCAEALMAQDQLLSELLGGEPTLVLEPDTLVVQGNGRSITFLDREVADPDRPLEATLWTLTSVIDRDATSSVAADAVSTLSISDGTAFVATGCNTGSAPVTIGDDTLELGPLALTEMACDTPLMDLEARVVAVLGGSVTYQIEASVLTVTNGSQGLQYSIAAG